jgi:hypothetical protein
MMMGGDRDRDETELSVTGFKQAMIRTTGAMAAALALAVAAGCGGDEQFETPTYPFSFEYPSGWKAARNAAFTFGAGERSVSVIYKLPNDQVVVTQYKLNTTLPPGVIANQREVDRVVRRLAKQSGGTATEARKVEFGGISGYQYVIDYQSGGVPLRNTLTFLFRGDDQFQITCQSSEANREEVDKGCDMVLSTIKFED